MDEDWIFKAIKAGKKGGQGRGNWGHAGRPGEVGGSAPSGSGGGATETETGGNKPVSYDTDRALYKMDYDVPDGYYRPDRPIKVFVESAESHPTNAWYGASQIYEHGYTEYTATPKDVLIRWPGGDFMLRNGTGDREKIKYVQSGKSPFEREYGGSVGRMVPVGAMTHIGREYTPRIYKWEPVRKTSRRKKS